MIHTKNDPLEGGTSAGRVTKQVCTGFTRHAPTSSSPPTEPGLVRAFAEAVAAPGQKALLYRPGGSNEIERLTSLPTALHLAEAEGRPCAVYLRPEILAGDYDQPEQAGAAVTLAVELRAEGLQPVLVASGQPGRRHLFVRVDDVEQRALVRDRLKASGADVRAGKQPIRPPLSPHRLGLPSRLLAPTDATAALDALRGPESDEQARPRRGLSEATTRLLGRSPPPGCRSELVMGALLGLANAGLDRKQAWATLRSAPLGGRYAGPGHGPRARFDREWSKACRRVEEVPAYRGGADVRLRLADFLFVVEPATYWKGMAGASALAVLRGHAAIACRRGAMTYTASLRELAERAGLTLPTVRAANLRLRRLGLLAQTRLGGVREGRRTASSWSLTVPVVATFYHTPHTPRRDLNGKESLQSGLTLEGLLRHDASRWRALGKNVPALLLALESLGTARTPALAARLGRHRVTVCRQLARLVALGLAERSDGKRGLYRLSVEPEALAARLDRVAVRLGTAGVGLRMQEAFEEQRMGFDAGRYRAKPQKPTGRVYVLKQPVTADPPQERRQAAQVRRRRSTRPPTVERGPATASATSASSSTATNS